MAVSRMDGFSDLVRAWLVECLPRAVAYARSLVRDGNEADDLVQECVYRLLKRAGDFDLLRDGSRLLFRAITDELRHVLDEALAQLPVAQRAALELKSWGQSLEGIAEALSITRISVNLPSNPRGRTRPTRTPRKATWKSC